MTPKEKAEDLVAKYFQFKPRLKFDIDNQNEYFKAKQYSLIAVDEILFSIIKINKYDFGTLNYYWQEVKKEIEKL